VPAFGTKTHPAGISIGAADPPCVRGRALHEGVFQCRLTWAWPKLSPTFRSDGRN